MPKSSGELRSKVAGAEERGDRGAEVLKVAPIMQEMARLEQGSPSATLRTGKGAEVSE